MRRLSRRWRILFGWSLVGLSGCVGPLPDTRFPTVPPGGGSLQATARGQSTEGQPVSSILRAEFKETPGAAGTPLQARLGPPVAAGELLPAPTMLPSPLPAGPAKAPPAPAKAPLTPTVAEIIDAPPAGPAQDID